MFFIGKKEESGVGERYNRCINLNTFDVDEFDRWCEASYNLTLYY